MKFSKIVLFQEGENITDFAAARNEALKKAKGDWILFLDTDEKISPALATEIKNLVPKFNGYYLKRDDYFFGRWLKFGETANVRLVRLARKDSGKWSGKVHEVWKINGPIGELKNPLQHYPHPSIKRFVDKINHYTDIAHNDRKFKYFELLYPAAKFFQNYILRLGFLDGLAGFVMAFMMSFQSLITRVKQYDFIKNL